VESMRKIQYVSKYIALAEEGLVPKLECPMDQGLLFPNQDLEGNDYLYCLSCNYKNIIGIEVYDSIIEMVENNGKQS
jgi:hypothetical protein